MQVTPFPLPSNQAYQTKTPQRGVFDSSKQVLG